MDLSNLSKIKDISDRYKDCIKSATTTKNCLNTVLIMVRELSYGVTTFIVKHKPQPEFEEPTNLCYTTNFFLEYLLSQHSSLGKMGGMLVYPITQYEQFIAKVKKYKETLKKKGDTQSRKLIADTKEYQKLKEANTKKFEFANYTITKQNIAVNKADKMYNPTEIARLDNRATEKIKAYESEREKITCLKTIIMKSWSDIHSLCKDNFSQLVEQSREQTTSTKEIYTMFCVSFVATLKSWQEEMDIINTILNTFPITMNTYDDEMLIKKMIEFRRENESKIPKRNSSTLYSYIDYYIKQNYPHQSKKKSNFFSNKSAEVLPDSFLNKSMNVSEFNKSTIKGILNTFK